MCDINRPFSCLPERHENPVCSGINPDGWAAGAQKTLHGPWCLDLSVPARLLIILIHTIHGVLVGLLDLGDQTALCLPVADSPSLVSKQCIPHEGTRTVPGIAQEKRRKK